MKDTVAKYLNRTQSNNDLKYIVHSSHDTQQWNVKEFLQPLNYDPIDMPYASTIFFELHYDEGCLNNTKTRGNQCFTVQVLQNGSMLKFDTCMQDNNMQGRFGSPLCSFDSFIRHIDKLKYQGPLSINEACVQPYNPKEKISISSLFMH